MCLASRVRARGAMSNYDAILAEAESNRLRAGDLARRCVFRSTRHGARTRGQFGISFPNCGIAIPASVVAHCELRDSRARHPPLLARA